MRLVSCLLVGLSLLIFQGLLFHLRLPSWLMPQGLLVCVVFLGFYECSIAGAVCAFLLGLMLDMSSGIVLGPWAGAYTALYLALTFLSQRLFVESIMVAMSTAALSNVFAGGLFLVLAFENQVLSFDDVLTLLGQGIASAFVVPLVFAVLGRAWRRVGTLPARRGGVVSAV